MDSDGDERKALGRRLAEHRKAAGFTLASIAKHLTDDGHKIGKAGVGHWETGQNVPDALTLARLARAYKTSSDTLLGLPRIWPLDGTISPSEWEVSPETGRAAIKASAAAGLDSWRAASKKSSTSSGRDGLQQAA